jgi:predicted patatin/cPLA2 family phospholipase
MINSCLVLEGGGLRGAFTGGVLEYLLENNLNFERVVGVSAGACLGASYVSRQKGRNRRVNVELPSDRRYMGIRHLITTGSYFNMKFIFEEIPDRLVPFDEVTYFANPTEFDIVITSLKTGNPIYLSKKDQAEIGVGKSLVASSSIPLLSKPVDIQGELFLDGGVGDPIPVKYAMGKSQKAVVVLTRPRGYRKEALRNKGIFKFAFRKYPEFLKAILRRNEEYNKTLDFCDQMEKEGKLFILAPSPEFQIGRTEKSYEKRLGLYNHGYSTVKLFIEPLRDFLYCIFNQLD